LTRVANIVRAITRLQSERRWSTIERPVLDGEYQPHSNVACVVYGALEQEWDSPEGHLISSEERRLLKARIESEAPNVDGVNVKVEI
jgi:hypothetical protein